MTTDFSDIMNIGKLNNIISNIVKTENIVSDCSDECILVIQ